MSAARLHEGLERWRESMHAVDRAPGEEWRSRLVHHGFRGLCVLGLALLLPFLFPRSSVPEFGGLEEGEVADRDILAQVPFTVFKSEEQLASERREAEQAVAPIFAFDPSAADTAVDRVRTLFARIDSATAAAGEGREAAGAERGAASDDEGARGTAARQEGRAAAIREVLQDHGVPFSQEQLEFLADPERRSMLQRSLESAFRSELPKGVAPTIDLEQVSSANLLIRTEGSDRLVPQDSVRTVGRFFAVAGNRVPAGLSSPGRQLYQTLLVRFVEPSVRLDRDATRRAREQARSAVEASAGYVLQGERIVAAHERIGKAEIEKLRAYEDKLREEGIVGGTSGFWRGLGSVLFGIALLGLLGAVLLLFRPDIYRDVRDFSLVFVLVAAVLGVASVIAKTGSPPALIPVAFAALLIGALFDGLLAVVAVAAVTVILAGQPGFTGVTVPFVTLVAGATAALGIREIRRRSQSWILIAAITGAYVLAGVALLLLDILDFADLAGVVAWGGVNATVSTALAMGAALPALERFTGRTTDQTLLELADLNQSLLRRLSREAPGTYAHSVSLANLAEAACVAIGANALLARVGTYYHDIGKMQRPQYFIENQPKGLNPHDRLPPSRSAEVIREHVRDGLRLADEARLPRVIKDFIREHHGTQQIAYFLTKAQETESALDLDPADFCYPGPKPQSKETAVVMLADAVESASRTLAEPTPERIRALIDRLVEARIEEGQLDQSPLTLRDLDIIRSEFARVLTGLYHHRIDYPETNGGRREGESREGWAREGASPERVAREGEPAGEGSEGPKRVEPVEVEAARRAAGGEPGRGEAVRRPHALETPEHGGAPERPAPPRAGDGQRPGARERHPAAPGEGVGEGRRSGRGPSAPTG